MDPVAGRLGENIRQLREARGFTQAQMARLALIPRATWANLESGAGNPTLAVLHKVGQALQVSIEELISSPRSLTQLYPASSLPVRLPAGGAKVRRLLPDRLPGVEMDRIELGARCRMTGIPHTPGTREYLTCEAGELHCVVGGQRFQLRAGDVLVFQGDQRHSYLNPGERTAVGFSVVLWVAPGNVPGSALR